MASRKEGIATVQWWKNKAETRIFVWLEKDGNGLSIRRCSKLAVHRLLIHRREISSFSQCKGLHVAVKSFPTFHHPPPPRKKKSKLRENVILVLFHVFDCRKQPRRGLNVAPGRVHAFRWCNDTRGHLFLAIDPQVLTIGRAYASSRSVGTEVTSLNQIETA